MDVLSLLSAALLPLMHNAPKLENTLGEEILSSVSSCKMLYAIASWLSLSQLLNGAHTLVVAEKLTIILTCSGAFLEGVPSAPPLSLSMIGSLSIERRDISLKQPSSQEQHQALKTI